MYTCTCTMGRQKEFLVLCLSQMHILNLWVHMNMIKLPLTHASMLLALKILHAVAWAINR